VTLARGAPLRVSGTVRVPGDKSISHRALLLAAIAEGESRIRGILASADVQSTADVLRTLGVAVPPLGAAFTVPGRGRRGLAAPGADLDCGNSGTTARLVAGIVAASPFTSRFVGDASLSRRPMRRVARPLQAMGAQIDLERGDGLPMRVHGGDLHGIEWATETASAQIKSAVLLAAVVAGVRAAVTEPGRSRDHTERMLATVGVTVRTDGRTVGIGAATTLTPLDIEVPADPSSAAFFAALAALADRGEIVLPGVCLNPTRTGFLRVLERMGARIVIEPDRVQAGEETGTVRVAPAALHGTVVVADEVPALIDELPILACLAVRAEGETTITGAGELRVKESDRIAAVVDNLRRIGAEAEELADGMRIRGGREPLRGSVRTHGDHRLAMAFGVLRALPGNAIQLDDPDCVAVSYPGFWADLARTAK
jgi:3-phosphoshikimate 1-carboxyvinyltransferase